MAKPASDRFGSAQEVAQLLEDCLAHVQQPTVKELPGSLTQHLLPRSGSSRPARLIQRLKQFGIRAWLLAGIIVTAIVLMAMMLQDNLPQRSGQGESGPLTVAQANLNELVRQQKAREESIRQISYKGTVRQYAKQDIQRTNTESVDEFVARCVGLAPVYDEFSPYPLSASRDFSSGVYRFTVGDINAGIPNDIKYMDWFIDKKKYVQLMGRDPGTCDAVVTNNREDIRDDREASLVRLDIAAFQPVKDILMSEVLTKAISEPGIPDVGGRPLWKLEPLDSKVGWKATFMFQQPVANPPGAKQILWHRVYWEQIGGELVIVRVEKLTVDGDEKSTPQSVVMIDDYRSVCGRPVPFRIRFFNFGNVFVQGAELIVSDLKINDYVDVPDGVPIPEGARVRNLITGEKSRQPASKNTDPITDAELIQGTWNVLDLQQVGYEASEDERNIYKNGGYKITFTKNKMIHSPDHSSMQYRVDRTETPHVLELLQSGKVIAKAIYELAGDDLKICQGRTPTDGSEPEPPTSFDINQAPTKFPSLYILRRTKPIEPIAIPMAVAAPDAVEPVAHAPSILQNSLPLQTPGTLADSPLLVEARKALQTCQNSLSWKQKFDMRVTNSYVHRQVGKVTIESRVRRDAPRMVESSLQTFDDKPKDHIRLDNWCLDDGEMFIGRTTTVGQKKLTGLMTIKGRQKASWRMFESSSSFAMEGHFPGNQGRTLMELLMDSKEPDVRMEKIGDQDCLRISDRNDWGTMTVWIEAGPSRRLRQWESSKERGNRFADGRVGEDKDTANLESFSYFVEDIQYKVIDGLGIAVSCRVRSTSNPNGGIKQETSTEYKRTEIQLRPDFGTNNPFVGDFDNGARINDGDAFDRDTAFRWQDGKLTILPNTKQSIVDENKRPSDATVQLKSTKTNSVVGHWKVAKLADMPAAELAGATVVIDENSIKMHVPSQKGPHPHWRYKLATDGEMELRVIDDAKGETISRAKYLLEGKTLYLALNGKKGDYPRPESATGEVPQAGVQYIVLELDELAN